MVSIIYSSPQNFNLWITSSYPNWKGSSYDNIEWLSILPKINNSLIITDPLYKDIHFPTIAEYANATIPPGYFIALLDPKKRQHIDVAYNFENKTIGYFDISELYFIKAIIQSYRMNIASIKLIQLKNTSVYDLLSAIQNNYIDILITYILINSDLFNYIQKQRVCVMGFSNIDFTRVSLFYPYISPVNVQLQNIFTNVESSLLLIPDFDNNTVLPKMTMKLCDLRLNVKEGFITRLSIDPESVENNFGCYGNPYTGSKAECESPNDLYGNPQERVKWDKECTINEDCPFYAKNTQYSNTRGGCKDNGLCEMPIGVLQASPRKYFDSGRFKPFCYGCPSENSQNCCNTTQDYAFMNDTVERKKAGLKTSIPLM
jgi:hypothetical protein